MGLAGGILLYLGARYFFTEHFAAPDWLRTEILDAVPFLALSVPLATLTGVASGALQGREKFLDLNLAMVVSTSLFQLVPLATAYIYGPTLKWLVLSAFVARLIGLLVFFLRVHRHIFLGLKPRFDRTEWLALLKYGGWITVTTLLGPLIIMADRLMLGAFLGSSPVAIYAVAFDIARRLSIFPSALGQAIFPRIVSSNDADRKNIMLQSLGALAFFMTAPVVLGIYLLSPLMELWIGIDIGSRAASVGRILFIAYWANGFAIIPFVQIQARGRPDLVAKVIVAQIPFHIILLYYGIELYGLMGAAIAVALRSASEVFVMLYFANRGYLIPKSYIVGLVWVSSAALVEENVDSYSILWIFFLIFNTGGCLITSWFLIDVATRKRISEFIFTSNSVFRKGQK
jgi:O-antigen/teichoic acid export membrane protein